jgi:hypothetical protein
MKILCNSQVNNTKTRVNIVNIHENKRLIKFKKFVYIKFYNKYKMKIILALSIIVDEQQTNKISNYIQITYEKLIIILLNEK